LKDINGDTMKKKRFGIIAFAIFFLALCVAFAIPQITVNIQKAAMGQNNIAAPVNVANVNLVPSADGTQLTAVQVNFDQDLASGATIYVYVYDSNGNLVGQGHANLSADLPAGNDQQVNLDAAVDWNSVDSIKVFVIGPKV
jgi:hypothetical protein